MTEPNKKIPYEWEALLHMVLGTDDKVTEFNRAVRKSYKCVKTNEKMEQPIVLWGPAGSGKSTILSILELGFYRADMSGYLKSIIFVHDHDFFKTPDPDDPKWKWISSYPVLMGASNRIANEELYTGFGTTGDRFEKEVYNAIVKVCEDRAADIFHYYFDE